MITKGIGGCLKMGNNEPIGRVWVKNGVVDECTHMGFDAYVI